MYGSSIYRLPGKLQCWLILAVALCVAAVAEPAAAASPRQADGPAAGIVHGWQAGPVSRGTGYGTAIGSTRVREVQRDLDRLDYRPGPVDGLFGPLTEGAVRRYQSDRELIVDGVVGSRTLASLRARTQSQGDNQAVSTRPRGQEATSVRKVAGDVETLPSWWILVLLVPAAFCVAVFAAILALRGLGLVQNGAATVQRRLMRHHDAAWDSGPAAGAVYVEGLSANPAIGRFHGFAYWMWPTTTAAGENDRPTLLVYDRSKSGPVHARTEEITAVNGRALERKPVPGFTEDIMVVNGRTAATESVARGMPAGNLRIMRRIGALHDGGRPGGNGVASSARFRPLAFRWIGARVHLAHAGVETLPGTLSVELELFAEGERMRWETGRLAPGSPFHIRMDDLEHSVERTVLRSWIPELAAALAYAGVSIEERQLRALPFAVERSLEVELALAKKGVPKASLR